MDRQRTGVLLTAEEKSPSETMCGDLLAGTVQAVRRLENLLTLAQDHPRAVDAVVALALFARAVAMAAAGKHQGPLTLLGAAATCATVVWRGRAPAAMTAVAAVSITVFGVSSHGRHGHMPTESIGDRKSDRARALARNADVASTRAVTRSMTPALPLQA